MSSKLRHLPVLSKEVLSLLQPKPGEVWFDATVGLAGHSQLILTAIQPNGRLIAMDQDPAMMVLAREKLGNEKNILIFQGNFDQISDLFAQHQIPLVDGLLADLGICSVQLDDPQRGFSFRMECPLDMRMNQEIGERADQIIARSEEEELADIFYYYGEERQSRRIARKIVQERKKQAITTTGQLANIVRSCLPRSPKQRIDPATRVFQALRIAVNDELGALERFLSQIPSIVKPGGRVGIISFHSLEDRMVKLEFKKQDLWSTITRKPIEASEEELKENPRCRSAKLRVAILKDPSGQPVSNETNLGIG